MQNRSPFPAGERMPTWFRPLMLAWLGAWMCLPGLAAQSLALTGVGFDDQGRFQVRFEGDASSYYLLRRRSALSAPAASVAMALGEPRGQGLIHPISGGSSAAYFSVERRPRFAAIDSDGDGMDDVFELERPAFLNPLDPTDARLDADDDGATNREEYDNETDPAVAGVKVTRVTFSPESGEGGVSVGRETVVRFSRPLAAGTVLTPEILSAQFGGRRILSRAELATDRQRVALFYLESLPGGARIRVILDGDRLVDDRGVAVDANADGRPGGVGFSDFETTANTAVAGTAIQGTVFASEVVDGREANRPLAGVTVTVDGREESLRAVTDAAGRFVLDPAPAGDFFVHVDGRTSPDSQWPGGAYYPFVGKRWSTIAGRRDNQSPGGGVIHLPRIAADALQPVSATDPVVIGVPASVLAMDPRLAGVQITVPANALLDPQGGRGGRVGIAPVPPDRLPGPLPPGLEFPLVITVQTDGPQNFDQPVPVRFPNLPVPGTGAPLPPGAKSALWSFNHDTGDWEIAGPMTVTPDGRFVETDPGFGILQPGWHGWFSGCSLQRRKKEPCENLKLSDMWDIAKTGLDCARNLTRGLQALGGVVDLLDGARKVGDSLIQLRRDYDAQVLDPKTLKTSLDAISAYKKGVEGAYEALTAQNPISKVLEAAKCAKNLALVGLDKLCVNKDRTCSSRLARGVCNTVKPALESANVLFDFAEKLDKTIRGAPLLAVCTSIDLMAAALGGFPSESSLQGTLGRQSQADPRILGLIDDAILASRQFEQALVPAVATYESMAAVDSWLRPVVETRLGALMADAGALDNALYAVELEGGIEQRGRISAQGGLTLNVRPGIGYRVLAYDPANHALFIAEGITPPVGRTADLADFRLSALDDLADADQDGLPDLVEEIIGTNPKNGDTDGDGISDLAEVRQGLDPLGGRIVQTGIIATAQTPGNAVDVAAANGVAVTANETGGISVFNLGSGRSPIQVAQVAIPGRALRVALGADRAFVAADSAGLVVVDISDPPASRVVRQIGVGDRATSVAALAGMVGVGTSGGELVLVDSDTGTVMSRVRLGEAIRDLGFGADHVYALTDTRLHTVDFTAGTLTRVNIAASPTSTGIHRRLTVADTRAYAVQPRGANVFDLIRPWSPRLVTTGATPQIGWKQIAVTGSGAGVAAVGVNNSGTALHHVSLYDLTDPTVTDTFLGEFVTPGVAGALSLYNGLAYVADGEAGLQVLNFLPHDRLGRAPTIRLTTSGAPGRAEAGQWLRVTARVTDDVQVAQVTFLLNGRPAFTDGNFPFEFTFVVGEPRLLNEEPFTLGAIAVDTGGNAARAGVLTLQIVPDAIPPRVRRVTPFDGALTGTVRSVAAHLSEPPDPATVNASTFLLLDAGPDGVVGTDDDRVVDGVREVRATLNLVVFHPAGDLQPGDYRIQILPPLADVAGNRLEAPFESSFRLYDLRDDDGDGVPDELEPSLGLDPTLADTDGDGIPDGNKDFDRDGLPNAGEVLAETDPRIPDTDGNGRLDGLEDPDGDALDNAHEFAAGSHPRVADTDRDGWNDEAEVTAGSDPLNPLSRPFPFVVSPALTASVSGITETLGAAGSPGPYIAGPPLSVTVSAVARGAFPITPGGLMATPPVRVTVPAIASEPTPISTGGFIARPPLRIDFRSP